jgi:histidinol-phosphate aminotransferase
MLNRMRQPFNINAMAQAAGVAALGDDAHVGRTRRMVARGHDYFRKALDLIGLPYLPGEANFMLVRVGDGRGVFEALLRRGVIVRPVDTYGLPEYVRVTIGMPAENKRFIVTLAAVLGRSGTLKRVRTRPLRFGEEPT